MQTTEEILKSLAPQDRAHLQTLAQLMGVPYELVPAIATRLLVVGYLFVKDLNVCTVHQEN